MATKKNDKDLQQTIMEAFEKDVKLVITPKMKLNLHEKYWEKL